LQVDKKQMNEAISQFKENLNRKEDIDPIDLRLIYQLPNDLKEKLFKS
jgi:hypothetical protein